MDLIVIAVTGRMLGKKLFRAGAIVFLMEIPSLPRRTNKFGKIISVIRLNPNVPLVAYNKLPPGHCVKVTTKDGNSGTFQVLDTGSFDKLGRVIDLSFAAAKQLKLKGTTERGITVQSAPCPPEPHIIHSKDSNSSTLRDAI